MATTLPSILTLTEVAALLRLSPEAVVNLAEAGKLPGQRQGDDFQLVGDRRWQFLRHEVEAWSERCDPRKILLRQVGIFADDESLPLLQAEIDRQRQENTLDATDSV
jgi:Helix-turn-helix domain